MTLDVQSIVLLLLVGLVAGVLSGFVGIGGGVIMVPALIWLLSYSQQQAQGTSLAVLMFPVVFLAVRNYYKAGAIDPKVVGFIAVAFVVGSYFGSKWSLALPMETVRKVFGAVILLVALKMIFSK
ncbi:MAG TPA: sulfite exporter TauE/SafE family protein [Flavobacteriales bacterium]|nr:sulfite exporter TauE/SafE family protein [Flavobacteriales bacterium]HNU55988.1 sulfite exporter TauE/SafE family protein [Flavobacteriales bacterium]